MRCFCAMRTRAVALLACAFLLPQVAEAMEDISGILSFSLPKGWVVSKDANGTLASPGGGSTDRSVSLESCRPGIQSNCPRSCEPNDLRPNYFYFFNNQPAAVYSQPERGDDFRELRGVGPFGNGWVAASVICGPTGFVYVGATSNISKRDALTHLNLVVKSIRWH
jgi:hypothetical protein